MGQFCRRYNLLPAIHTRDADSLRRSHAHTATGAGIFARARYSWRLGDIRAAVVCAGLAGVEAHAVIAVTVCLCGFLGKSL